MSLTRRRLISVSTAAAFAPAGSAVAQSLPAETDHARLLRLLNIDSLRLGADGWNPSAPNAANYDEARANPWPDLPDPLKFDDGRPVRTQADWAARRLETVEHFEREIYGRVPPDLPAVAWRSSDSRTDTVGGPAVRRRTLAGQVGNSETVIAAELVVPDTESPSPVVLALVLPPAIAARFPVEPGVSWREQVLARGFGYVEYVPLSVQGDDGASLAAGVIGLGGQRGPEDWGALRAWAWGASQVLDALETLPEVDARRVCVHGLSRYGKAALAAMAFDERFRAGFIASSGAGGAKLHRRDFGERIENLASPGLYHWMAGNYLRYAGPLTGADLPVDAHQLVALCAPRPVFVSVGSPEADNWTDPRGMFMATVAAGPLYRLLGAAPLSSGTFPPLGTMIDGDLAFRQHQGGHTAGPNWPHALDWLEERL